MLAPYAGVLYSAPRSGPDPRPRDPARPLRLRQRPPPAADAPPGRPSPLFFCVRAISFSISEIFSRIPMAAAEPGAQARQTAAAPRTPARQRRQISVRRKPTENGVRVRPARRDSESGRATSSAVPDAIGSARWAGGAGEGWGIGRAGPGRGQAGGGEARRRYAGAGRGRPKGTPPRWTPHCGSPAQPTLPV